MTHPLTPRLIVRDAAAAIDFYERAFGAEVLERYQTPDGQVVHCALKIHGAIVGVVDADPSYGNHAPDDAPASPVILHLEVDDPDAAVDRAVAEGAEALIPIDDRVYGHRDARLRDPFGHLWLVFRVVEDLAPAQIQALLDG
ncbi:MAG TPA: VOC family protein [Sandaracinaceae bacterium LLY-WYZ-13_1]|nr:VOC family protein [Sandaracinaceae bacterium LLY-WYZ-13_1]